MTTITYDTPDGETVSKSNVEFEWEEDSHLFRLKFDSDEEIKLPPHKVHEVRPEEDDKLRAGGTTDAY
jgi:hypothetical protein